MAKKQSKKGVDGLSIIAKVVFVLVALSLLLLSVYAFMLLLLGMMPTVAGAMIDRRTGKFASKTIGALNFTGILPFLFEIWNSASGDTSELAKQLLISPYVWLVIYGAAAAGWVMIWLVPQLAVIVFTARADLRIAGLKKQQQELVEEWGEEVRQFANGSQQAPGRNNH